MNDTHLLNERAFSALPSACRTQERELGAIAVPITTPKYTPLFQPLSRMLKDGPDGPAHPRYEPSSAAGRHLVLCSSLRTRLRFLFQISHYSPSHTSCVKGPLSVTPDLFPDTPARCSKRGEGPDVLWSW